MHGPERMTYSRPDGLAIRNIPTDAGNLETYLGKGWSLPPPTHAQWQDQGIDVGVQVHLYRSIVALELTKTRELVNPIFYCLYHTATGINTSPNLFTSG